MRLLKTIITVLIAVCACTVALAQDEFYRAGEFSVDTFYQAHTSDFDKAPGAPGIGLNYFPHENIGLGLSTAMDNVEGTFFEEVAARGIYRMPFGRNAISLWAGGTFNLESEDWRLNLGPEVETRLTKNVGAFLRLGIDKQLTGDRDAAALVVIGVRAAF